MISHVFNDGITIYDGANTSGPVLFSGDNGGDFTGLSVTATSGDIYITIQMLKLMVIF